MILSVRDLKMRLAWRLTHFVRELPLVGG